MSIDTRWQEYASCSVDDLDLFFPAGTTGDAVAEVEAAKAICQGCRVQARCLQFALETNQQDGVWGGTAPVERRKLRRAWIAAHRPPLQRQRSA